MKIITKITLFTLILSSVSADTKQQNLFNTYDKNQDKKISKEEWLSYHLKDFSHSDSKVAAKMKEMKDQMKTIFEGNFKEMDKNKDGFLTKDEMFN